jgi:hypothetical protein
VWLFSAHRKIKKRGEGAVPSYGDGEGEGQDSGFFLHSKMLCLRVKKVEVELLAAHTFEPRVEETEDKCNFVR